MKNIGTVEVPPEAFVAALSTTPARREDHQEVVRLDGPERSRAGLLEEWSWPPTVRSCGDRRGRAPGAHRRRGARGAEGRLVPHEEAEHEHLALQHWHGRGAVRLLRADPRRFALLLERLHQRGPRRPVGRRGVRDRGRPLRDGCTSPRRRSCVTLDVVRRRWTDGLAALPRDAPVPHRLVEQAVSLGRDLVADPASTGRR